MSRCCVHVTPKQIWYVQNIYLSNVAFLKKESITTVKVKIKVTLVKALRLCTGRMAHRGSRGIALPFHDHSTRRGWGVSFTLRPLFTPAKTWHPLYRRLCGTQGRSGHVCKISPPTGTRSPDRPAHSQSLYRLSFPAHITTAIMQSTMQTLKAMYQKNKLSGLHIMYCYCISSTWNQ